MESKQKQLLYKNRLTFSNKLLRTLWIIVNLLLFKTSPTFLFGWRRILLILFGAKIGENVHVYPSAKIWAPWNLKMENNSCLGNWVDCYSVDKISIGINSTISQYTYLCSASHDISDPSFPLITKPINIGPNVWVAAQAFIGFGVTIGEGSIVGAKAAIFKDVQPWTVVGGNPARVIKKRVLHSSLVKSQKSST